jgi:hypothetical protein
MKESHHATIKELRSLIANPEYVRSVGAALGMLLLSFVASFFAALYATIHMGAPVPDLILNTIPSFPVYKLYVYGPILFVVGAAIVCLRAPRSLPFVIKAAALFTVTRAFFVALTHLGLPSEMFIPEKFGIEAFRIFFLRGDLFFSGHAGFPFLFALIFWKHERARSFFLAASAVLALSVLLGHYHYSIDVFAAYFITYTVFAIAKYLFAKDYSFFLSAELAEKSKV